MTRVLALGEAMGVAVTPRGESLVTAPTARLHTAGAEATVAIGLSRMGVRACWLGVVGTDGLGARVVHDLSAEGVVTDLVRRDESAPTGFMVRELRTAEITRVTYYRSASAGSLLDPVDVDRAFDEFGPTLVHVSGVTAAISESAAAAVRRAVQRARDSGVEVSLDVNHRPTMARSAAAARVVADLVDQVDVLFVGDDELHVVTEETAPDRAAQALAALGPGEVIVKLGGLGSVAVVDGHTHHTEAARVEVVDVVGAGDSFVAGYLAARSSGHAVEQRLRWGTVAAAFTVGSVGDWEGLPTRAELERYDGTSTVER